MGKRNATILGAIFGALIGGAIGLVVSLPIAVVFAVGAGHGGLSGSDPLWLTLLVPPLIGAGLGGWLGGRIARRGKWSLIAVVTLGIIAAGVLLVFFFVPLPG